MDLLIQQLINGLSLGALYALIAVGYTVVYGIVQLINFAHGEVFMMGAFGAYTTWMLMGSPTSLSIGMALGVVLPAMILGGVLVSVGTALLMERFAYRPLRNAPRLAPLISAIGLSIGLQEAVRLFYGQIPGLPRQPAGYPVPA
jgi:branched-chain amino acid transport system permease protein